MDGSFIKYSAALGVAAGLLALAVGAGAEPRQIAASLTLERLVEMALAENPQLRASRAEWEAAQERPVQATTLPNPMLTYMGMDRADAGAFPDTNEKRVVLQQQFPWFGKLGLRGQVAREEAAALGRAYDARARDVVMHVKEAYFDLYAVQQSLAVSRAEVALLERMEEVARTRYAVGQTGQQDVLKAQAEISLLKVRLLELEQQELTQLARINTLLDRPADAPLGLAVTAPGAPASIPRDQLVALAEERRPEIQQARVDLQQRETERALARKEFWPDYTLGVEYRHFDHGEDMVMVSAGVELPLWQTKYRAGVRGADKRIESGQATLAAARRQTSFDVQDAWYKLQTAQRTVDLYRQQLIPQAEARYRSSEAAYRTGRVDFLDLLDSERFLLDARLMLAGAEGQLGAQAARLERAVGTELPQPKETE